MKGPWRVPIGDRLILGAVGVLVALWIVVAVFRITSMVILAPLLLVTLLAGFILFVVLDVLSWFID